ncbi:hypothetical protein FF011L_32190 [Roseimaritima multifibrata]|uniref:Planctomycete cytochrome C n=1 Tax=Roseimaritima multifibrata TaxID=1930274 RepID=A0A517MHT4_9BACT|nr:hypothetical protein FF011L_32190 [Roseimaritima multifibrata]
MISYRCLSILLSPLVSFFHFATADEFDVEIKPLLTKYCIGCHNDDNTEGEVNFATFENPAQIDAAFKTWESAAERLVARDMPPEGESQPTDIERERILHWYQNRFVDSVVAKPASFRPRRLSAVEYRNTLQSLFGFELEVAIIEAEQTKSETSLVLKLLPDDPPGRSGFRNDTHSNPLTTVIWDQYSFLTDHALSEFFAPNNRHFLEAYVGPLKENFAEAEAEKLVRTFAPRALRRPLPEAELSEIIDRIERRSPDVQVEDAVKRELKAILMSPSFLYRGLRMERIPGQQPVDDFELAERLSYFLWGDMPDATLTELAKSGTLGDTDVLKRQVDRMLLSPQASHLATDFAFQWLAINEIEHFGDNYPLQQSMEAQVVDFMQYLFTEDRPLIELIDSDVSFINPLIARHYGKDRNQLKAYRKAKGIEVEFVSHQKITLEHSKNRGGILTMPGILAMNKGPVLRGTWVLERILGDELPDPPMNVGSVPPPRDGEDLTFRQRFELHRANVTCASCHDKIDPLGFALQRYDDSGSYVGQNATVTRTRGKDSDHATKGKRIDTSGRLPSGETFEDMQGLKHLLATSQRRKVIRNIVERTLSYALCRALEIHDRPTVDQMVDNLDQRNGTYRDLFHAVVLSLPFRETVNPIHEAPQ